MEEEFNDRVRRTIADQHDRISALEDLVRLAWDTHVRCGDGPSAYAWIHVQEVAEGLGIRLERGGRR